MTTQALATMTLLKEIRACTPCTAYLPLGPRPILQFDPQATLSIADQAPGGKVHARGVPFQDASGDRLRDRPPRPECADTLRARLMARLVNVKLTLLIGQYAQNWHLGDQRMPTLTETVRAWRDDWPASLPLPHPSPRNNPWLERNAWFEADVLPSLRRRVAELLR